MRALITGITGQDGSYLAELLLEKGYDVHGLVRPTRQVDGSHIGHLQDHVTLHPGDVTDPDSLTRAMRCRPDEVYNLAAQTHVGESFDSPGYTLQVTGVGAVNVMRAAGDAKVYQASTSELFGATPPPQSEGSPFRVRSPYGAAKLLAHETARIMREQGRWVACGILFNHESPRRHPTFVTRKIAREVARIKAGLSTELRLGNLQAERDWGHARDFVEAMWLMLQQDTPEDFVIATGETHTVREFAEAAFVAAGMPVSSVQQYVTVDPKFFRPNEVHALRGDASKARELLGWSPSTSFDGLVGEMVSAELEPLRQGAAA